MLVFQLLFFSRQSNNEGCILTGNSYLDEVETWFDDTPSTDESLNILLHILLMEFFS